MLNAYGGVLPPPSPPAPPPRYGTLQSGLNSSTIAQQQKAKRNMLALGLWRESMGVIFLILSSICVAISSLSIFYYAQRQKAVYEEIVDYLDKTVSISKINYNPGLGLYEIRSNELDTLADLRKYKFNIWAFLFSDLACYIFFVIALFIYYTSDLTRTSIRFFYWLFFGISAFYALAELSVFSFLLFPQVVRLPNATEELLDHAVPFNTGGLMQMERRLGCIFNQNLYSPFKRRQNSGNTCDPYVLGSFITRTLLVLFVISRAACAALFAALATCQNPLAQALAAFISSTRPKPRYKNRYTKNPKKSSKFKSDLHTPKSTTFGVNDAANRSVPSSTPPPGQLDHSISYNNAAFFATAGSSAFNAGNALDNSSEISKGDMPDILYRGSTHTTNSLVSEV